MASSEFKDLVIEAVDAGAEAAFWATVLGLAAQQRDDVWVLRGEQPTDTVWINAVPETKTVKNRVHLDVHVASVEDLQALGATVQDDSLPWTVMDDPDGQEFCAFVRRPDQLPELRLYELVVDCAEPESLARWWADRFGVPVRVEQDGSAWVDGGTLPWPMVFDRVPERKTVKNRVHWDVWGDVADYQAAGARLLRARSADLDWDVLADPEGNEFCVFAR